MNISSNAWGFDRQQEIYEKIREADPLARGGDVISGRDNTVGTLKDRHVTEDPLKEYKARRDPDVVTISSEAMQKYKERQGVIGDATLEGGNMFDSALNGSDGSEAAGAAPAGPQNEALEELKKLLEEAQKRLQEAQQKLAQATAEVESAGTDAEKAAAMTSAQAAQLEVSAAQAEVSELSAQIMELMNPKEK